MKEANRNQTKGTKFFDTGHKYQHKKAYEEQGLTKLKVKDRLITLDGQNAKYQCQNAIIIF